MDLHSAKELLRGKIGQELLPAESTPQVLSLPPHCHGDDCRASGDNLGDGHGASKSSEARKIEHKPLVWDRAS